MTNKQEDNSFVLKDYVEVSLAEDNHSYKKSSPGEILAGIRKEQGIELETIAHQLRIDKSKIIQLENGDYENLPDVFVNGYLHAYARFLQLNPEDFSIEISKIKMTNNKKLDPYTIEKVTGENGVFSKQFFLITAVLLIVIIGFLLFKPSKQQEEIIFDKNEQPVNLISAEEDR